MRPHPYECSFHSRSTKHLVLHFFSSGCSLYEGGASDERHLVKDNINDACFSFSELIYKITVKLYVNKRLL